MAMNKTDLDHASNKWGFFVMFTLVALLIAVVLAFVGGRSLTQSQIALNQMSFQQQELKRLEILINDLPGGVAFVEVESGVIVRCNEAFRTLMGMTFKRKYRSSLKVPFSISASRSLLVAAMTRTSTWMVLEPPTLSNFCS